ncbi:DUF6318 family protein [Micrococcus lylae]|uniref:DUF6318 family protein n=1 Tax=Micrococcus lylae TaxID=1273 RepID=UPI000B358908|nr:DUF6318 family protein [Micrococcus lylae]
MRRGAPARGLALTAALALALTACSGGEDKEPEETVSPSTTAPASQGASSDGADEQPETGGTDESTETTPDDPDDPDDPDEGESPDADDSDPNGEDTGEYVPASADGPAKNVPKPVMPEEMKKETPEGAKAAVQYWWDTVTYLQRTGDLEPLREVSSDECDFCHDYALDVVDHYEDGGWHTGMEVDVTSALTGVHDSNKGILQVTTLLDTSEAQVFDKNGLEDKEQGAKAYTDDPWVTYVQFDSEAGHWRATQVSFEGKP